MNIDVNGHSIYAYTGGKALRPELPTAILIHGVLCDHSVWALQSRYLANHGWNVLAIDLPGHCRSQGPAPASVEDAARFIADLMDAAGLEKAALVGHSWGSLIALQAAADLGARVSHLALVGTAHPMKVSPALLESALNTPEQAIQLVNTFSRATLSPPGGAGSWVFGAGVALGRRVLASNAQQNLLHTGFLACDRYTGGETAIAAITCPVLFALGAQDQMTPPKAAQGLIQAAQAAGKQPQRVLLPMGHNQMTESPDETLFALRDFLQAA
ncbi:alpha/beta fold hydrolase [Pantoea sp. 18069]|uniref:alpha/beta fold hydrolase n=1 Tax=Pantoea sp. 18069 TaxID=2681415 RepID=UPI00135C1ACC|nr:alpha/beta hydrolase [Pantoea sp. 18069]